MYTVLEQKRRLLEDLELIEYAISKRIKVNPKIYKPKDEKINHHILRTNRNISRATTVLQQHEVKLMIDKYLEERENYEQLVNDADTYLNDINLLQKEEYQQGDFTSLLEVCESIQASDEMDNDIKENEIKDNEVYEMFSADPHYNEFKSKIHQFEHSANALTNKKSVKKLKKTLEHSEKFNYLSSFASNLKLSMIFSPLEVYGTQLDLKNLFNLWLALPRYKSIESKNIPKYKSYLQNLFTRDEIIKIDTPQYELYLQNLKEYLVDYIKRAYPLENYEQNLKLKAKENDNKFKFQHPEHFCLVCNKQFAKDSVYASHLNGKKHMKQIKKVSKILDYESEIASILQIELKHQLNTTVMEIERIELLTVRERELEKHDNQAVVSDDTASLMLFFNPDCRLHKLVSGGIYDGQMNEVDNNNNNNQDKEDLGDNYANEEGDEEDEGEEEDYDEDEDDENLSNPLNLPIGPDGRPIPFWLWKLKGLGHKFKCEICADEVFQGRKAFNKHFYEGKHIEGLKALGITSDFENFKDINEKKDALALWDKIKEKNREKIQFLDNSLQVEDQDGNAMSKKVYDQLKKQGLI